MPPGTKNDLDVSPPRFPGRGDQPSIWQPAGGIIHPGVLSLRKGMNGGWLEECSLTSNSWNYPRDAL